MTMRVPLGTGLVLVGSGIYWSLSGVLIASFSVLAPGLFSSNELGRTVVVCAGVVSSVLGLWVIGPDLEKFSALLRRRQGWLFTIPLVLVSLDLFLTVAGLSRASVVELNPFVEGVFRLGAAGVLCYALSYSLLSVGIALMVNQTAAVLFAKSESCRLVPYSMVCGAASFGVVSNTLLILGLGSLWMVYTAGTLGAGFFSVIMFYFLKRARSEQVTL